MILNNVELNWARLDPTRPDMGYDGNSPQWSTSIRTRDKDEGKKWKDAGLNVKVDQDDKGVYYDVKVRKDKFLKNGKENSPVPVVGKDLMPLPQDKIAAIGNGTTANIKLWTNPYEFNGRKGVSVRIDAVQIIDLVEYKSEGPKGFGFKKIEQIEQPDDEDAY